MLDESSTTPLYMQLYHLMLEKILKGEWPPDYKLPTEQEFCTQYKVSRMTVRQAMEKLKAQGYLHRKQGRGTFVQALIMEQKLPSFYSFSDQLPNAVGKPESLLLNFKSMPAAEEVAIKLEIAPGEEVFRVERIRIMGEVPFAHEFSYVPCSRCPLLTADSIRSHGLYKSFQILIHQTPDTAQESFQAILIDKHSARHLNVHPSRPALKIERVARFGETVLEYCVSIVKGDSIKYEVFLPKKEPSK